MSDDANDVTKALAAFGAPSIRYHSFGQAQIKPSSIVLPRRVTLPGSEGAAPVVTRQEEPSAAPEPAPMRAAPVPLPPSVADTGTPPPLLRQAEPLRAMPPPPPTVAPPPRPLAEWAAPVTPAASRPMVAPPPLVRSSVMPPLMETRPVAQAPLPSPAMVVPPLFPAQPATPAPVSPPKVVAQTVLATPPVGRPAASLVAAAPLGHDSKASLVSNKPVAVSQNRSLQDVFEFLASSPERVGMAAS